MSDRGQEVSAWLRTAVEVITLAAIAVAAIVRLEARLTHIEDQQVMILERMATFEQRLDARPRR